MLDTVHLNFSIILTPQLLTKENGWDMYTRNRLSKLPSDHYTLVIPHDFGELIVIYHPFSYSGKPLVVVKISSLPKLLDGNNYTMLKDLQPAMNKLDSIIEACPGLPNLKSAEGILGRVDFCTQHFVGEHVDTIIKAISQLHYPHRERVIHSNSSPGSNHNGITNGVAFKSEAVTSSFYNKQLESKQAAAYGQIQDEISIKRSKHSHLWINIHGATLGDITPAVAYGVFEKNLDNLGIKDQSFASASAALEILIQQYGPRKGHNLHYRIAFMAQYVHLSKPEIAEKLGIQVSMLNSNIREVKAAGIAPSFLDIPQSIPPFEIDKALSMVNLLTKVPSDTRTSY